LVQPDASANVGASHRHGTSLTLGKEAMTDARDRKAKEIQDAIREVLYRDWDPLNVCDAGPKDEYDSYIGAIYRILASSPSREAVARELVRIESESMGFDQVKEEALLRVADKLLSIDIRLLR
jgi:hypothetical protein